jgi:DNA-binding CsgD family transcriptional regulator
VDKLQAEEKQLTEQDVRFLVLVLLDLPAKEIADIMNLSQNSISNKKTRTAQKLGTIVANLRETLISLILKTKEQ